jgi:RND family efflux transporter MFP subunit
MPPLEVQSSHLKQVLRTPRALAAVVVLLVLLALGGSWLAGAFAPRVTTAVVTRGEAAEVVYATGTVEPRLWAKVVTMQRKRIVDICRCEGQQVKQGDILVRLDDVEERAQLTELEARLKQLNEDVARLKTLLERNVTSRTSYDEKVTQVREYEARIAAQRERLGELVLRAPMDGTVLRRDGEVGEIATTGVGDVLFWVGQPRPLRIVADVNEEDILKVATGQRVLVRHDAAQGPLEAVVDEITPKGDPTTKTFRVYLALPDDTPLRIGMSVEANIVVRQARDAALVPSEAVSMGGAQVIDHGRIRRADVKVGIRGTRLVEVVSGLSPGDVVVSPARADLRPGDRVHALPAGAGP